jgi:hypothetical protein
MYIYSSSITGNISIQYSLIRTITTNTPYKKAGVIKYVPSSGIYPTSGNWEVVDFDTIISWNNNGNDLFYSGEVVTGTDIQPPGNSKLTVNDSIPIIGQEFPSLAIKKINASGQVLKTFDIYFNLTNDDIVFSLLDSQNNFNFLIGSVVKMIISTSGVVV